MLYYYYLQALKSLRMGDVKPYIVFIAAPNPDRLRANILQNTGKQPTVSICIYGFYMNTIINAIHCRSHLARKLSSHKQKWDNSLITHSSDT